MALGAAAARVPSSRKHAGTRAARAVALQASKVDTVCIVGCSGAVGKDWADGVLIGMAWMAMEESEKHLKNTFFFQIFIEDFMRTLEGFSLACRGVFSYFKWSPRPLTLIPSPVVIFSFG